ncbi:MAG: hypothetical protein KAI55_04390, partial [Candidatus Aenigmarchaeota archaeon]|nr:hypothetical protein [Candidatus Aenigmarchaeota archaeon]
MNKTKIREINLYLAILFVFFFIPCSFAIPQTFNIHGKLTDSNGANLYGTYNMTFRIYDAFTGGIPLWQSINQSVSTDSEGVYTVVLKNINLTFSEQYYIGVAVQSDAEMTPRINLTSSGYSFRTNVSDYLESSRNYEMANLTLTQKITFALGEIIDNIVGGWVRITGGLNVSENVTASYFIGDGSRLTNVNGSGVYVPYTGAMNNLDLGANNFLINNSVFFVNATSGNVGIGTANPNHKLQIMFDNGHYFEFFDDGDIYMRSDGADFRFGRGGVAYSIVAVGENKFYPAVASYQTDLGTSSYKWRNLYVGNNTYLDGDVHVNSSILSPTGTLTLGGT